jgi:hypothetical protein
MTAADRVYCKWCGTAVTGGGLFCPSCGREVEKPEAASTAQRTTYHAASYAPAYSGVSATPPATVAAEEESQGLFGRLASVFGHGIAFVLALIVGLIGTVLPILIVVALFMGPGDTWEMVRGWIPGGGNDNPACEGFDDWYEESADRSHRLLGMLEDYQSDPSADPASLRSFATEADAMAAEQRRSSPPPEAVTLNGVMVETLELWADALRAIANGDQAAFQSYYNESTLLTIVFDNEEQRVFDVCR